MKNFDKNGSFGAVGFCTMGYLHDLTYPNIAVIKAKRKINTKGINE